MSNEIEVKNPISRLTEDEIIKKFFPKAQDNEDCLISIKSCIAESRAGNLNPLLKDCYFVPYKNKTTAVITYSLIISTNSYIKAALATGDYAGCIMHEPVKCENPYTDKSDIKIKRTIIKKDGSKWEAEGYLSEYYDDWSNHWRDHPHIMLSKSILCKALKEAFGLGGIPEGSIIKNNDKVNSKKEDKDTQFVEVDEIKKTSVKKHEEKAIAIEEVPAKEKQIETPKDQPFPGDIIPPKELNKTQVAMKFLKKVMAESDMSKKEAVEFLKEYYPTKNTIKKDYIALMKDAKFESVKDNIFNFKIQLSKIPYILEIQTKTGLNDEIIKELKEGADISTIKKIHQMDKDEQIVEINKIQDMPF